MKKLPFLLLLTLFLSCQEEEAPMVENNPNPATSPFEPYVSRFFEEGKKRGFRFDRELLDLAYMTPNATTLDFCGYGYANYNSTGRQRVEINPRPGCWEERDEWEKEGLMFHELGHAVLARFHDNWRTGSGLRGSMMCGGPDGCNQFALYNEFTPLLRAYYVDELFDRQTPVPEWAFAKNDSMVLFLDDLEETTGDWRFFESGNPSAQYTSSFSSLSEESTNGLILEGKAGLDPDKFAAWRISFFDLNLEEAQSLRLTAKIAGENVSGGGAALVIRTDAGGVANAAGFSTTQGQEKITGTFPPTPYQVTLPYVPDQVHVVHIFLLATGGTAGTLFFDEVELTLWE